VTRFVVRYTFRDGSTFDVDLDEAQSAPMRQRAELKRLASRANGKRGGRPPAPRPSEIDVVLMHGELWSRLGRTRPGWRSLRFVRREARVQLIKEIAGRYSVDARTARGWVNSALGPAEKSGAPDPVRACVAQEADGDGFILYFQRAKGEPVQAIRCESAALAATLLREMMQKS
jgi:hypothetical protein